MSTQLLGVQSKTGVCAATDAGAQLTTHVSHAHTVRRVVSTVASSCPE